MSSTSLPIRNRTVMSGAGAGVAGYGPEVDVVVALALAGTLAAVHLLAPRLGLSHLHPRSPILSAFGGVSVAYVVVHLLPDVAKAQAAVEAVSR